MYFKNQGINPVDLRDPRVRAHIEIFQPILLGIFFKKKNASKETETSGSRELLHKLPHATLTVEVLDQIVEEVVIACLARDDKSYLLEPYFISLPYHPHYDADDDSNMHFIFKVADRSSYAELVVEALAEEVAIATNKLTRVEKNYLRKRWDYDLKRTFLKSILH